MANGYTPLNDQDTNWLVYNSGRNVSPNFNFMLRVEAVFDLPCRKVMSFTKANEYEYIQEGGLNDYVHMRRKPVSQPFSFQVERYVGVDYIDPLQPGADLILPVVLLVWRQQIWGGEFTPFRVYTFTGCNVMSKTYGELNAEQSGLLTETTTIGYREMVRITVPDGLFEGSAFQMDAFEELKKDPDKHNMVARHPVNDDKRGEKVIWTGFEDKKNPSRINVRGKAPVNNDDRSEVVLWDGMESKSTTPLRGKNSELEAHKPEDAVEWKGFADKDHPSTEVLSAQRPAKDKTHVTPSRWEGNPDGSTKTTFAIKQKADAGRTPPVKWGGPKKNKEYTAPVRAQFAVDEQGNPIKQQRTQIVQGTPWDGFKDRDHPSSKAVYARTSEYDDPIAAAEGWPDTERAVHPKNDLNRAVSRKGGARKQMTDRKRAKKVLWPKQSRAMTVELLKSREKKSGEKKS